jgi:alpha-tubulin suppressor-like RCC1 family protein
VLGHGVDVERLSVLTPVPSLAGTRVRTVTAAASHTLVSTEAGAVLSFGWGEYGCLGQGDEENQHTPEVIEALRGERVVAMSAGDRHSLVLTEAGVLLSFGYGGEGRLGHGDEEDQLTPMGIEALRGERVVAVGAGKDHSLVLTEAGAVLSFGDGRHGRLGHSDDESQRTPKVIEALRGERVVAVAAGGLHSLVLTEAGAVLSFGGGHWGRLGHGDEECQRTPKVIEALRGERVVEVLAGFAHSLCVLQDDRVFGWGYGDDETLGLQLAGHHLTPLEYPSLRLRI